MEKNPKYLEKQKKQITQIRKSKYSSRSNAREVFEDLIGNAT